MKNDYGFTLVELMIVLAIISIVAAIAIPNMLRARMSANEASAVGSMRALATGEVGYLTATITVDPITGIGQYGTLVQLTATAAQFIDPALAAGSKSGYDFVVTPVANPAAPTYTATARPSAIGSTGTKSFFVNENGSILFSGDPSVMASAASFPIS